MAALCACKHRDPAIAVLASATGTPDRQPAGKDWAPAALGVMYFIGDGARVAGGTATLEVGGGAARILMLDGTTLRLRGTPGKAQIVVETGAIDLTGSGSYALDIGDVTLPRNGSVRITAKGGGRLSLALTIGDGKGALSAGGQSFDLVVGAPVDVGGAAAPVDAAVVAAPPASDAAAAPAPAEPIDRTIDLAIDVTGKARLRPPHQTAWQALPPGPGTLPRGAAIQVAPGANSVRANARGAAIVLDGGAQLELGDDGALALPAGPATITADAPTRVALPGGAVSVAGEPDAAAEVKIQSRRREAQIAFVRGGGTLTGAPGSELALRRGEAAVLSAGGVIRVLEAIPNYFDFRIVAGESLTIHDPRPPTAVQLQFADKCPERGTVELDTDPRFSARRVSEGRDFANALIKPGAWFYRLRCTNRGVEGPPVATGRIVCLRDDGRRPLPRAQAVNDIDADGRTYRISYQSAIPSLAVHVRTPGAAHRLHLAASGKEQLFVSDTPTILIPGNQLREGTYTYWLDRAGEKPDKVSTLIIDFDQTAPQVYIESPGIADAWAGDLDVRGAVLPGWSAAVEGIAVPIDRQRRFAAKVGQPSGRALAIQLSHPQRGVHYYLRRPKPP